MSQYSQADVESTVTCDKGWTEQGLIDICPTYRAVSAREAGTQLLLLTVLFLVSTVRPVNVFSEREDLKGYFEFKYLVILHVK